MSTPGSKQSASSRGILQRAGNRIRSWFATPAEPRELRSARLADVLELEDRSLLSATPIDPELIAVAPAPGPAPASSNMTLPIEPSSSSTSANNSQDRDASVTPNVPVASQTVQQSAMRHEVVLVDASIANPSQLIEDVRRQGTSERRLDVFLLNPNDGLEQVADHLAGYANLDAVHILSHAREGALRLGNEWLDAASLDSRADEFAQWGQSLAPNGDLLIYGCDLASSPEGAFLLNRLSELTGADVAASEDLTGHASLGGNWTLEASRGEIETPVAVSAQGQESWNALLATLTINTTNDLVDGNTSSIAGLLSNQGADGKISLREAFLAADNTAGADTIVLPAGVYLLTEGEIQIEDDTSLVGAGPSNTIIDGGGLDRVFKTSDSVTVSMDLLTIQGGQASDNGGAILVDESSTLTISNSVLTGNNGGTGRGGAIHVHGTLNLNNVLLVNNTSGKGGAIYFHGAVGGSLINVTLSGNVASEEGGAIWTDTPISIKNTTITQNSAENGGGIYGDAAAITISNTIIAGNDATSANKDVMGAFSSDGKNLIQVVGSATGLSGDLTGVSANLQSLADNGGPTRTHALSAGSAAIDAGTSVGASVNDQRGYSRSGATDIGAFEYNGVPPNTPPTITSNGGGSTALVSIAENSTVVTTVAATDPDVPGQTLTYAIVGGADASWFAIDGNTGQLTFITAPNYEAPGDAGANNVYEVTVEARDGSGGTDVQTLQISVTNVNEAPVNSVPGSQTIPGGANFLFRPEGGNVISISDVDALATDLFQVTLTVTNGRVQLNTVLGVTFIGGANNSPTVTIQGTAAAINDALDRVKFKPDLGYIGAATLTIQTNDLGHNGGGGPQIDTDVINLNVVPNTSPVLDLDANNSSGVSGSGYRTLFTGAPVTIADSDATISDIDSVTLEQLTVTIQNPLDGANEVLTVDTSGTEITATYSGGVLTLVGIDSRANYQQVLRTVQYQNLDPIPTGTSRTIAVVVNDGNSNSNTALSVITINNSPVAADDAYSTPSNLPILLLSGGVLANDTDAQGTSLSASLVSGTSNGILLFNSNGTFTYVPNLLYSGIDTFTYRAFDGTSFSNVATVIINVGVNNTPPIAVDDAWTVAEDASLTVTAAGVLANDADANGNPLTAHLVSGPAHGTISLNANGSFLYTPDANFSGTDTFTYQSTDGLDNSNVATVTITVSPVNDAPVAGADAYSLSEDTTLNVTAAGVLANDTDVEGSVLTAHLVSGPAHGTLNLNPDGSFTYTPNLNFNGSDSFTYKTNDGSVDSNVATVTLVVTQVNDAPLASNDSFVIAEDTPLTVAAGGVLANDVDPDGPTLAAFLVTGPSHGSLTLDPDGSFTYTPNANYFGADSFTYQAGDGTLTSNVATVTISVVPINDVPSGGGDAYTLNEDGTLAVASGGVLGNDSDVEGDSLSAELVSGPNHGSLTLNSDGTFIYTPVAHFHGTDSFLYRVKDSGASSPVGVTVTVLAVDDAPSALGDAYNTLQNTGLVVSGSGLLGNDSDVDGDPMTVTLVAGPATGELILNADGSFAYTPEAEFTGEVQFTYKVLAGGVESVASSVTIAVQGLEPLPPVHVPAPVNPAPNVPDTDLGPVNPVVNDPNTELGSVPQAGTPTVAAETIPSMDSSSGASLLTVRSSSGSDRSLAPVALTEVSGPMAAGYLTRRFDLSLGRLELAQGIHIADSIHVEAYMRSPILYIDFRPSQEVDESFSTHGPDASLSETLRHMTEFERQQGIGLSGEISPVGVVTSGLVATAGYLLLNPRSLAWILTLAASRSAWKSFDPLEVIYAWEEDKGREGTAGPSEEKASGRPWWSDVGLT